MTKYQKTRIYDLYFNQRMSISDIAELMGLLKSTVIYVIKKEAKHG